MDTLREEYELQLVTYNEAPDAETQDVIYYRLEAVRNLIAAEYLAGKLRGGHYEKPAKSTSIQRIRGGIMNAVREVGTRVRRGKEHRRFYKDSMSGSA